MQQMLFMTVGMGKENPERLAHGLFQCIDQANPDKILFFVSDDSEIMVTYIKEFWESNNENFKFDHYELVKIEDPHNYDEIFSLFKKNILKYQNDYKIYINYTSGTKTMSMAAGIVSALFHKQLVQIEVSTDEEGYPIPGTEELAIINLYKFYDELLLPRIKSAFNNNRFEAGKELLNDFTGDDINSSAFNTLFDTYYYFDSVDFNSSANSFDFKLFKECDGLDIGKLAENNQALNIITFINEDAQTKDDMYRKDRCYYILAAIFNNAKRRCKEHKYDDAVARLYRCLELIAQIRLKEVYGIETDGADFLKIRDAGVGKNILKKYQNKTVIKLSLRNDYEILMDIKDDNLGEYYRKHEDSIDGKLSLRNKSILAHGIQSRNDKDYDNLEKNVLDLARLLNPDIDEYISKTEFPKFD